MSKHRHERSSWFIGGSEGGVMWCYQCGAIREMDMCGFGGLLKFKEGSKWTKPTGDGGENPVTCEVRS